MDDPAGAGALDRRAADVYWARIATVDTGLALGLLADVFGLALGWLPEAWLGRDPRYRVLVGRRGTGDVIGVRQARTGRAAQRQLAEVRAMLTNCTAAEARRALELDF